MLKQFGYFLRQALLGMKRSVLIQIASIGAVSVALLLIGIAFISTHNLRKLAEHWGKGKEITVYLNADASDTKIAALSRMLDKRAEIKYVNLVSAKQAHKRLQESLGEDGHLLNGVSTNLLPRSFEIELKKEASKKDLEPLLALLKSTSGVEEVEYIGRWAERLGGIVNLARDGSLIIALIIALACLYIVAMTIRLGVFARRDEIEIQKLVGATNHFVRAPFLIEGMLQGIIGTTIAAFTLYAIFQWASPAVQSVLGAMLSEQSLSFLTPLHLILGVFAGMGLGILGSGLAINRYLES